jgi:hypoxanthine phosphoribosyltransferase
MEIHEDIAEILVDEASLQRRIIELGYQISKDYAGQTIMLVGILKGAIFFLADLARHIQIPVMLDFMAISSYGNQTESQGVVRIVKDLDESIDGKHVLLVEDIIDSGLTLDYVLELLRRRNPASLRVCTLLDKIRERDKHVVSDYIGFRVRNEFVVGYGLDYAQNYRHLHYIGILKPSVYTRSDDV